VARLARLSLGLATLVVAACGGGETEPTASKCPTSGSDVTFPLLDPVRRYTVAVHTNLGTFAIELNVKDSPCTTSSFTSLVRRKFFDGTRFHRIVPGFVIQGGDPTGTGTGGPGYTVRDIPKINTTYSKGVVAMAKSLNAPRGTAGSQFFVMTANSTLPPDYAILGKVTSGLDVVEQIGRLGFATNEKPTRKIVVLRMTIRP
jgi:cyclophilin family peptidyl-prolyl cis-trans isomerase